MTDDPGDTVRNRVRRHLLQALAGGMALGAAAASAQTKPNLPVVDPVPPPLGPCTLHPEQRGCARPPVPVVDPVPPPYRSGETPNPGPPTTAPLPGVPGQRKPAGQDSDR